MIEQTLDESTKKALDGLSEEEVSRKISYCYEHEILWYGIDAVAYVHLMREARDILRGRISSEEFIEKYGLDFDYKSWYHSRDGGFLGTIEAIERDGIFIPKHRKINPKGNDRIGYDEYISYFNNDKNYWGILPVEHELVYRVWKPEDLENGETIRNGINFGEGLWRRSVSYFEECQKGMPPRRDPLPEKIRDLTRELIKYYDSIVFPKS